MSWKNWFGGWPGVATFALMACGVMALPLKFPFYDNLLLIVFSAFTYLIAANSAAYAFGRPEVAHALSEGHGDTDRSALFMRAQPVIFAGVLGWAALVGLSLLTLKNVRPAAPMPHPLALLGLAVLNGGLASLVAMVGALVGLNVRTVKGTRDLLRMGFTFLLALAALVFFVIPDPWRASLIRFTRNDFLLCSLATAFGAVFSLASELCRRRAVGVLAEKRQGLSILG